MAVRLGLTSIKGMIKKIKKFKGRRCHIRTERIDCLKSFGCKHPKPYFAISAGIASSDRSTSPISIAIEDNDVDKVIMKAFLKEIIKNI